MSIKAASGARLATEPEDSFRSVVRLDRLSIRLEDAESQEQAWNLGAVAKDAHECGHRNYVTVTGLAGIAVLPTRHRSRYDAVPLQINGRKAELYIPNRGSVLLEVQCGIILRGQAPEELGAELKEVLCSLAGTIPGEWSVKDLTVTSYFQCPESSLPPMSLEPLPGADPQLISYGGSEPYHLYPARDRSLFAQTRARRWSVIRRGSESVGFVCGSMSGGVEVLLSKEATELHGDPDLRADLMAAGRLDSGAPVREFGLTFSGNHLGWFKRWVVERGKRRSESDLEATPHLLKDLVSATVGDGSRSFFRLAARSEATAWESDSVLWTHLREGLLEAMPQPRKYENSPAEPARATRRLIRHLFGGGR